MIANKKNSSIEIKCEPIALIEEDSLMTNSPIDSAIGYTSEGGQEPIDGMEFECVSIFYTEFSSKFICYVDDSYVFKQEEYKFSINDVAVAAAAADEIDDHNSNQSDRVPLKKEKPKREKHKSNSTATRIKEKRYACEKCDKAFNRPSKLLMHSFKHSGFLFVRFILITKLILNNNI